MAVRIVTDSTSDIPPETAAGLEIEVVPALVNFGLETFRDRVDLPAEAFFERLRTSPQPPTTSQPAPAAFEEVYQRLLDGGAEGIVSIHLARPLSGLFESAWAGAAPLRERLPVAVLDSGSATMGLGWAAILAARAARQGASHEEVVQLAESLIPHLRVWAALDTLEYLRRGGRVGTAQWLVGSVLSVKPLLIVRDGAVEPLERVRTRQRAVGRLVEIAQAEAPFRELAVLHTRNEEGARELADRLSQLHPRERMVIAEAGPVVATHAGPGAVGLCAVL